MTTINSSATTAVPKVTVAMVTYQRAPFIAQAIESALAQRTDFPFELVIGDNCSRDGTRETARDFAARFPDRIRLQLQERNSGLTRNVSQTVTACRG